MEVVVAEREKPGQKDVSKDPKNIGQPGGE